jgi:hypothetical protein
VTLVGKSVVRTARECDRPAADAKIEGQPIHEIGDLLDPLAYVTPLSALLPAAGRSPRQRERTPAKHGKAMGRSERKEGASLTCAANAGLHSRIELRFVDHLSRRREAASDPHTKCHQQVAGSGPRLT